MRRWREEFGHEYTTYHFGYTEWVELEAGDQLNDIYAEGFLPYSGKPEIKGTFYMARSARVPLKNFEFTSENRRVCKQFDGAVTDVILTPQEAMNKKEFWDIFVPYFVERHGPSVMPRARLESILASPLPLQVVEYEKDKKIVAYVIEATTPAFAHFWFSAYDLTLIKQSLGMWLMLDAARAAKDKGKEYLYVGTVYGDKALYKTNLEPLEFWTGSLWSNNTTKLKALARGD